jgi:hypothetical protein
VRPPNCVMNLCAPPRRPVIMSGSSVCGSLGGCRWHTAEGGRHVQQFNRKPTAQSDSILTAYLVYQAGRSLDLLCIQGSLPIQEDSPDNQQ